VLTFGVLGTRDSPRSAPPLSRRASNATATWLSAYIRGALSRRFVLGVIGPLTNGSFAVGAWLAVIHLPTLYDVHRTWVSSLASARSNPAGYAYLGAVFLAVPLMLVPLPGYLSGRFRASLVRRAGFFLLWFGIIGLFLLGVETTIFPNHGRTRFAHQLFTTLAFIGITPGFLAFSLLAWRRAWIARASLLPATLACAVLLVPGVGAGLSHVARILGALGWASLQTAKGDQWFIRSFVFWEWAGVIGLFVGGWLTAWAASREEGR
jgi:hypothetical protein